MKLSGTSSGKELAYEFAETLSQLMRGTCCYGETWLDWISDCMGELQSSILSVLFLCIESKLEG